MMKLLAFALTVLVVICSKGNTPVYTQVTFLYDIKRDNIKQYQRPFQYYQYYFDMLLRSDSNLIIFGDESVEEFVWERRQASNTVFIQKKLQSFKEIWYYKYAEKARQTRVHQFYFPKKSLPQFTIQLYNPIVMFKLHALEEALKHDKFNSDFIIWNDGGYMHQFTKNPMTPDNLIKQFYQMVQPQWVFFAYTMSYIMAGYDGTEQYLGKYVQMKAGVRASHFGGYSEMVRDVRTTYENILRITLENGDMNSEEAVFSLMTYKYPYLISNTVGLELQDFHKKIRILGDQNRKPAHPRSFRPSFESEGSIIAMQDRVITKYHVSQSVIKPHLLDIEAIFLDQDAVITQQAVPATSKAKKQAQVKALFQIEGILNLMQDRSALCKRVLFKQKAFLLVTLAIYLILMIKNRTISLKIAKINTPGGYQ